MLRLAATLGLLVAVGSPAQSPKDELLEQHVAWLGGRRALDALEVIATEVEVHQGRLAIHLEMLVTRDGRMRVDYSVAKMHGSFALDTGEAWELDEIGRVQDMEALGRQVRAIEADVLFGHHLAAGGAWTTSLGGTETIDDTAWQVLACRHESGALIELLLDPADGSCGFERRTLGGKARISRLSDWRLVDGVRFPFTSERLSTPAGPPAKVTKTVSLRTGVEADPARFARPKSSVEFSFGDGAWLPIQRSATGHLFAVAAIGEIECAATIDSGAGITIINAAMAERAGLTGDGDSFSALGVGGTVEAKVARNLTVRLGDTVISGLTAAILDLSEIERQLGRSIDIVLGRSLFRGAVIDIDYPNARLALRRPADFAYDGDGHTVAMRSGEDGLKQIQCRVEGGPPAWFQLDTGSSNALDLFKAFTDANGLLDGRKTSTQMGGGVGGIVIDQIGTLRAFTFAGYDLTDVPVNFSRAEKGVFNTDRMAGNLGAAIFERFRLIFDFGRDQLHAEPDPATWEQPLRRDRLGLGASPDEQGLVVRHVSPGSPAAAAGFAEDDRITAIDGVASASELLAQLHRVRSGPAGTVVVVRDGAGREHRIELADYR